MDVELFKVLLRDLSITVGVVIYIWVWFWVGHNIKRYTSYPCDNFEKGLGGICIVWIIVNICAVFALFIWAWN